MYIPVHKKYGTKLWPIAAEKLKQHEQDANIGGGGNASQTYTSLPVNHKT